MSRNASQRYPVPDGHVRVSRLHSVSPNGEVYSLYTGRNLRPGVGSNGRMHVNIRLFGSEKSKTEYIHVIVCSAFNGRRPEGMVASHLNGDKMDNRAENLAWETQKKNRNRTYEHGTHDMGTKNSRAVLSESDLDFIFDSRKTGMKHRDIADALGCSRLTVTKVLNGHRYRNHWEKRRENDN